MLASTTARVLTWYFRTREHLDSPARIQLDPDDGRGPSWEIVPAPGLRETLLAETCTVGLALARIPERDRVILVERYDPERGITDLELARALHCDREGARAAHAAALEALGGQLVKMGLVHMNGRPTWSG